MDVWVLKQMIRRRDGFKCADCGLAGEAYWNRPGARSRSPRRLDVHRLDVGEPYTMENSITLCRKCHKRRHSTQMLTVEVSTKFANKLRKMAAAKGICMSVLIQRLIKKHFRYWVRKADKAIAAEVAAAKKP